VKEYDIVPISHMPLLKGQTKRSATRDIITKEYYCFSYKKRHSNEKPESFIVGLHAAKHFLKLLKHPTLPIFDILKSHNGNADVRENISASIDKDKWNPLALELYRIINIILMTWDTNQGPSSEILLEIRNNKTREPPLRLIKSVNTIISRDSRKRTIYLMLEEFKKDNNIKDFKFPLITTVLLDNKDIIKNYITGTGNE
jgi:hypothetical protein